MAAESRFSEVSDEYLSSLLDKSIPKSTKKSTKYGMKVFNGRNAQSKFELLTNVTVNLTPFAITISIVFLTNQNKYFLQNGFQAKQGLKLRKKR